MKHTPGPWNRVFISSSRGIKKEQICRYGYAALQIQHDGSQEGEANANLIVAAPDMFEALQKALEVLDTMSTEDFARGKDAPVRNAIRAALARAEGR